MSWKDAVLYLVIAVLVALPPRYDPAIRLKEWLMKKRRK